LGNQIELVKTRISGSGSFQKPNRVLTLALIIAGFLLCVSGMPVHAQPEFPPEDTYLMPLDAWSFKDTNDWISDYGYAPVSFTNLTGQLLGDFTSVGLNTNVPALSFGADGVPWAWMGQGTNCAVYALNISSSTAFLILGTPLDPDGDGLTSAYELLVSKTDPDNAYSNLDGIPDGWEILLGLNPQMSNLTEPGTRANYSYSLADWLNGISGLKSGSVNLDAEGNVQSVSQ
jgi:hypothetical protein